MTIDKPWVFATKPVPECNTCSNNLFSVQHPHLSSLSKVAWSRSSSNVNILLGSSTLHNVWRCEPFRGQVSNFYYDIIIGGKIHDSHFSYLANTESWQGCGNIVIACGNNNADSVYNDSFYNITCQLESLVLSLKRQNKRHNIVISSLLYAPKYCDSSLPRNKNMLEKVRKVNRWIYKFNKEETGYQLDLGQCGVIGDPLVGERIEYRYSDWREPDVRRKLHLVDSVKTSIAKDLVTLYKKLDEL